MKKKTYLVDFVSLLDILNYYNDLIKVAVYENIYTVASLTCRTIKLTIADFNISNRSIIKCIIPLCRDIDPNKYDIMSSTWEEGNGCNLYIRNNTNITANVFLQVIMLFI